MSALMVIIPSNFTDKILITNHLVEAFLESSPSPIICIHGSLVHEMCERIDLPSKTFVMGDETEVGRLIVIIEMIRVADSILILDDGTMTDYVYYGEKFRRNIKVVNV